jgi:hypothetical protein
MPANASSSRVLFSGFSLTANSVIPLKRMRQNAACQIIA